MLLVGEKENREKYGGHRATWGRQRNGKVGGWHRGNGGTEAYPLLSATGLSSLRWC